MDREEIQKTIVKEAKKNSPTFVIVTGIALVLSIFLMITIALPTFKDADKVGSKIGNDIGTGVGTAIGSIKGISDIPNAVNKGRAEGLSAKDTTAEIGEGFSEIGKLEVLISKIKVEHTIEENTYAAIYVRHGEAIFTVDLTKADINYNSNNDSFGIVIPYPQVDFIMDSTQTQKVAEWEAIISTKSAEDGYEASLNSIVESDQKIKEAIKNYSSLENSANEVAKEQVSMLVKSITGKNADVVFKDGR